MCKSNKKSSVSHSVPGTSVNIAAEQLTETVTQHKEEPFADGYQHDEVGQSIRTRVEGFLNAGTVSTPAG